ncbi:MAG: mannose-1-phosphate guanylyltransferase [Candidatus Electryonea clarkiae]|nr:mannose-1-phosphate guanylyltransferase [Candidatus Electryonea clarkiae]MDP8286983.1 mannose-1-phosphate guanylyltransferase [Candidatus Electryonea clarkiae]
MVYGVIMAGGIGTRFWPLSTPKTPKQLLKFFLERSMIQLTIDRLLPMIPIEKMRIVTIEEQMKLFNQHIDILGKENYIIEPFAKNTAPCIGLAAVYLHAQDPDAIMVVLPADHLINDEEAFRKCLQVGIDAVNERNAIVTLGIEPSRPETGYGYIQYEKDEIEPGLHRVVTFAEKPNLATARRFIKTGEFLWNSGVFIWSAKRILSEIEEDLPELYAALMEINAAIGAKNEKKRVHNAYSSMKAISIDYGVMERARHVHVIRGTFDWSDVGNWDEVYRLSDPDESGNVMRGPVVALDTKNSYLYSEDERPLAVVGLSNVIVVDTHEGTLVCPRDKVQDVGEVAKAVFKMSKRNEAGVNNHEKT